MYPVITLQALNADRDGAPTGQANPADEAIG
jgi:hypothetical protein